MAPFLQAAGDAQLHVCRHRPVFLGGACYASAQEPLPDHAVEELQLLRRVIGLKGMGHRDVRETGPRQPLLDFPGDARLASVRGQQVTERLN